MKASTKVYMRCSHSIRCHEGVPKKGSIKGVDQRFLIIASLPILSIVFPFFGLPDSILNIDRTG